MDFGFNRFSLALGFQRVIIFSFTWNLVFTSLGTEYVAFKFSFGSFVSSFYSNSLLVSGVEFRDLSLTYLHHIHTYLPSAHASSCNKGSPIYFEQYSHLLKIFH